MVQRPDSLTIICERERVEARQSAALSSMTSTYLGSDSGSDSGSEVAPPSPALKCNVYSHDSQTEDDWSDLEEGNTKMVGTIDKDVAQQSATAVANADKAAGKAHNFLLGTVMVNNYHMDLCASSDDPDLRAKGADVAKWQRFMKGLDENFPSYPHYK